MEKKRLMANVLECMILACFENHIYKFGSEVRGQRAGGAIGLRATGSLAKVTMDWIEKHRERLNDLGINIWLLKKYVDDCLI